MKKMCEHFIIHGGDGEVSGLREILVKSDDEYGGSERISQENGGATGSAEPYIESEG